MFKNAIDWIWNILDKPRQVVFSVRYLRQLPIKIQRWIYFALSPVISVGLLALYLFWGIPLPTQITSESRNPVSTQILDRNGKLVYEIFEDKRRTPVRLEDLPAFVGQATIAIEDKDFYHHYGLSVSGMARALFKTTTAQGLQGGSTITQQLVKTTLLTPDRTLKRKIREVLLTLIVETIYSKDKILEMYLNNIPYGGTAWGIESAAHTYFGKPAKDLTLAEASLIAGLPQAPTRYSPLGAHPELSEDRQKQVLRRMVEDGYIKDEEAKTAGEQALKFIRQDGIKAPHFALFVKEQLVEDYGEDIVERGGLRVTTTLDLDVQEFAEATVRAELEKLSKANVRNGAAIVAIPNTGEILAMVGSKDYFDENEDGKVNVTLRERQPGSSIKPVNYALGLMSGRISPATPLA
ncbi:MAG: transglycosylase domain-containing protein, partial [bacterium]|nr:transglycosylase domain-containing protein [bacterium]